jgi:hypothetical protein
MDADFDELQPRALSHIDVEGLRSEFLSKNRGYCRLVGLIGTTLANSLRAELTKSDMWGLTFCSADRLLGIAPKEYRNLATQDRRFLAEGCYRAATTGFAFLREELWRQTTTAAVHETSGPIDKVTKYFEGEGFLNLCAAAIGAEALQLVELSFVRYGVGDFYAFTVGAPVRAEVGFAYDLTPAWELEWGGLLEFMNFTGGIEKAYAPKADSLCIYSMHKHHGISCVAPFARHQRYTIVGKLEIS